MQRFLQLALLRRDLRAPRDTLAPDPANGRTTQKVEIGSWIGLSDVCSKRAAILAAITRKIEIVVSQRIVSKRRVVMQRSDVNGCA